MTIPFLNINVSIGVLLSYVITAVLATPAAVSFVNDIIAGKSVSTAALWAAVIGVTGFLATTVIHQNTSSSQTPPAGSAPHA
jgi:hypothetical protein